MKIDLNFPVMNLNLKLLEKFLHRLEIIKENIFVIFKLNLLFLFIFFI